MMWRIAGMVLVLVAAATFVVTTVLPHPARPARPVSRMWPMSAADRALLHAAEVNVCRLRRAGQPNQVIVGLLPAGDHPDAAAVVADAETRYCPAYLPGGRR